MGGRYVRGVVCCVAAGSAAAFWAPALAPAIGLHHKRGDRAVDGMLATGLGQKGAAGSAAPQVNDERLLRTHDFFSDNFAA